MRDRDPNDDAPASEIEAILRALAEEEGDEGAPAPGDERLRAYRAGRLTAEENRELEGLLARSAAGRRRLLELAGIDASLPLRRVRRAVLGRGDQRERRERPARRLSSWVAAAAVAASIALALLVFLPRPPALPAGLAYDVSARGLAEVRSTAAAPSASGTRAYPETTLRILLRPRGDSPAGLTFALYRRAGGALAEVRQPAEVRLESDRGSASFAGAAAAVLATRVPGVYPLYAVVAARRELPSRLPIGPGQDPAAALRSPERQVYPLTVTLLAEEEGR